MSLPIGPETGSGSVDEATVEAIVRAWLGGLRENVLPAQVQYFRLLTRRFLENQSARDVPTIKSEAHSIAEVRARCADWTGDEFTWWCVVMKKYDWPRGWEARLVDAVADVLPRACLGAATFYAWKRAYYPQDHLPTGRWRELFNAGGYIEDMAPAARPSSDFVVLYRGSTWDARANWSWTSTWTTAERFRIERGGANGLVWVALVPWRNVLARNRLMNTPDRLADEWVVDTMDGTRPGWTIPIRPVGLPPRRAHWPHCRTGRIALTSKAHRCRSCGALLDGRLGSPTETITQAFVGRSIPLANARPVVS